MLQNLREATPLLMAIIFAVLFFGAFFFVNLHEFTVQSENVSDFRWRLFWGLSAVILIISMLWSYVISIRLIKIYMIAEHPKAKVFVYTLLVLVAVIFGFEPFDFGGATAIQLQEIIKLHTDIDIFLFTRVVNTLAAITIVAVVFGLSVVAIKLGEDDADIQQISMRIHRSLYSSSILLAAGVIEIFCLFSWAAALEPDNEFYSQASESLIIAGGLFFTLILLVIYVPLFMKRNECLRKHLQMLKLSTKEELENWYAINHLEKDVGAGLNDIIAYILPIMTGVVVNILSASQ